MRPQTARFAYGLALAATVAAVFTPTSVSTQNGEIPFFVVMPPFAIFMGLRLAGVQMQVTQNAGRMPWGLRWASWAALAATFFVIGLLNALSGVLLLLVYVLADAAGAAAAPETQAKTEMQVPSWMSAWAAARAPLLAVVAVASMPAFHFLVARYFAFAYILDWAFASLLAVIALRLMAGSGGRHGWEAGEPPAHHRVHRRVERALEDPMRTEMQGAVETFLDAGDAGSLLDVARETARLAQLSPEEVRAMESHVHQALARAGTSREEDLREALRVLDDSLSKSGRIVMNA